MSNAGGMRARMDAAASAITSSRDLTLGPAAAPFFLPLAPLSCGTSVMRMSSAASVSLSSHVMLALECMPNTSGSALSGSESM